MIEERRSDWEHDRIAELMRLRDYFSFMLFAQQERVIVTVCAANPAAGQWIGQPGVRCYDGALPVVSRASTPNEGLLAADPADPRLLELLNGYESPLSYAAYVELLQSHGLRVASADSGYLLEDVLGLRYHEAYRLHGVYDAKTNEPAWTSKNGERLRGALNRQLGAELRALRPARQLGARERARYCGAVLRTADAGAGLRSRSVHRRAARTSRSRQHRSLSLPLERALPAPPHSQEVEIASCLRTTW